VKQVWRWLLPFAAAGLLGGVGGSLRFAISDVPWPTFSKELGGVAVLAAVGTALRILLQDLAASVRLNHRTGMLAANVGGAAALAFAFEHHNSALFSWAFIVGFCGGLTTFSGFVNDALTLFQQRRLFRSILFITLTIGLSFGAYKAIHASSEASFPWRTLIVNLSGCFLFGFIDRRLDPPAVGTAGRRLLLSGFLGGYTTLSALVAETLSVATTDPGAAAMNLAIQIVGGAALILLGGRLAASRTRRSRNEVAPNVENVRGE
jgi:CrcB protein